MMKFDCVVGLGIFGTNVANYLNEKFKVKSLTISSEQNTNPTFLVQNLTHEQYDQFVYTSEQEMFMRDLCENKIIFFVDGSESISGMSLNLLSKFDGKCVDVVYFEPKQQMLSPVKKMQHKITGNILQEYCRSGALNDFYLCSEEEISKFLQYGIKNKPNKIAEYIGNLVYTLRYYCQDSNIMMGEKYSFPDFFKICSLREQFGTEIRQCSELNSPRIYEHFFGLVSESDAQDEQQYQKIEKFLEQQKNSDKVFSYSIHATTHEQSYWFSLRKTPDVQQFS